MVVALVPDGTRRGGRRGESERGWRGESEREAVGVVTHVTCCAIIIAKLSRFPRVSLVEKESDTRHIFEGRTTRNEKEENELSPIRVTGENRRKAH